MYLGLNTNIRLPDSHMIRNLKFTTLVVPFERESFIINRTARYSSTTSSPSENMRLIHMLLNKTVVYNSLCLQATNHYPETSFTVAFNKNFVCPHQRQSDPTTYLQSTLKRSGPIYPIYTYQSTKSALTIVLVLSCGLSTIALMVTSILMIRS